MCKMNESITKVKSSDFIAGYCYKSIEYSTAKGTNAFKDIPEDGFASNIAFPKVWVGGNPKEDISNTCFRLKLEDVMQSITDAFVSTFGSKLQFIASWGDYEYAKAHITINYRVVKQLPKKMTVAEIEKKLGYKIEIVSEDL